MDQDKELELSVRRILSEEIAEHRQFLQTQFKQLTWAIAVLFLVASGVFVYMLGKSINDSKEQLVREVDGKVVEYRINEDLKKRVNEYVVTSIEKAVSSKETQSIIEHQIGMKAEEGVKAATSRINDQVSESIKGAIKGIQGLDANELFRKAAIPSGAVLSFNSRSCPSGWAEYKPAYGRFIRGIDNSGQKIDPIGMRSPGSVQNDAFGKHDHGGGAHTHNVAALLGSLPNGPKTGSAHGTQRTTLPLEFIDGKIIISQGEEETRPKNVSLLFCEKR